MVKNSDTGQQEMVTTNKLTRLKQTLTTGFQQAQDSGKIIRCTLDWCIGFRFLERWEWPIIGTLITFLFWKKKNKGGNERILVDY